VVSLADNLKRVQTQIQHSAEKAGRCAEEIKLIAVSKTRHLDEVRALLTQGQCSFGENTIQDAMSKIPALSNTPAEWHFIGHLQSKKSKYIPGNFQWVHSVDSLKLAQKLSSALQRHHPAAQLHCLIQVNVNKEQTKSGILASELPLLTERLLALNLPGLHWRGLMTIGVKADSQQTRAAFARLRELQQGISREYVLPEFNQLSMGMSNDYEMAIAEGATMVRVGTALFGERQPV